MAPRLLPDGTPASSEEAYAEAWMRAGDTFGTLLPGWRFAGCGPNLEFVRYGVTGLGDTVVVDRVSISPEAARTIQAEVERRVVEAREERHGHRTP